MANRSLQISALLGIPVGRAPFTYLGVPIFRGKPRRVHLQGLADRAKAKMAGWVGKLIYMAGRVQLIRSVVQPLLLHSFMVYKWPAMLIRQLDAWMRNFVWTGNPQVQKSFTVAWHRVCAPLEAGGLGIRALGPLNKAGILRFVWNTMHTDSTWRHFMHARFGFASKAKYRTSTYGWVLGRPFPLLSCILVGLLATVFRSGFGALIGWVTRFCAPSR